MCTVFRLLALTLMLVAGPAIAQTSGPLAALDTSSPSATLQSFLSEARTVEKNYTDYLSAKTAEKAAALVHSVNRMRRLLDLSALPAATRDEIGGAAIGYLVDIIARLPAVPAAEIPGAPGRNWGKLPAK